MIAAGYYRDVRQWSRPWRKQGIATMGDARKRGGPILKALAAEAKARTPIAESPASILTTLERQCIEDIVDAMAMNGCDPDEVRMGIFSLADRLLECHLAPGEVPKPEVRANALMAAVYAHHEHMCLRKWSYEGEPSFLLPIETMRRLYGLAIRDLAFVLKCQRAAVEETIRTFKFRQAS